MSRHIDCPSLLAFLHLNALAKYLLVITPHFYKTDDVGNQGHPPTWPQYYLSPNCHSGGTRFQCALHNTTRANSQPSHCCAPTVTFSTICNCHLVRLQAGSTPIMYPISNSNTTVNFSHHMHVPHDLPFTSGAILRRLATIGWSYARPYKKDDDLNLEVLAHLIIGPNITWHNPTKSKALR